MDHHTRVRNESKATAAFYEEEHAGRARLAFFELFVTEFAVNTTRFVPIDCPAVRFISTAYSESEFGFLYS